MGNRPTRFLSFADMLSDSSKRCRSGPSQKTPAGLRAAKAVGAGRGPAQCWSLGGGHRAWEGGLSAKCGELGSLGPQALGSLTGE